jgi:hypothetical protein
MGIQNAIPEIAKRISHPLLRKGWMVYPLHENPWPQEDIAKHLTLLTGSSCHQVVLEIIGEQHSVVEGPILYAIGCVACYIYYYR